MVQCSIL